MNDASHSSSSERTNKLSAEPVYRQRELGGTIPLCDCDVELVVDGERHRMPASFELRLENKADLHVLVREEGETSGLGAKLFSGKPAWDERIELVDRDSSVEAFCVGTANEGFRLSPKRSAIVASPPSQEIARAVFHLLNFPVFNDRTGGDYVFEYGPPDRRGAKVLGRTELIFDGWRVEIAELEDSDALTKELKAQGGFAITHAGSVERVDRSSYSTEDLQEILLCVQLFLSFAIGRWAGLSLPVGFDTSGNRVFEEWGTRLVCPDAWTAGHSWFDAMHAELLGEVFPGFCRLMRSDVWKDRIGEVLWWYVGANEGGPTVSRDMATVLAQAALELLSWTYCVHDRKLVSERAFKPGSGGLRASDKLRLVSTALGLPESIPAELSALNAYGPKGFEDAAHAITELRNATVHPDGKRSYPEGTWYQGWRLSMWYLDLILLALCDHQGSYANRLSERWVGDVEPVPWAKHE